MTERKHKLRSILPIDNDRVLYCDHVEGDGESLFRLACENDLEGIVAKRKFDPYLADQAGLAEDSQQVIFAMGRPGGTF